MKEVLLSRGARRLVEVNARVRTGERVVVVTDHIMTPMAKRVASASAACGGEVVVCIMPHRERHGQEPPAPVAAAMREAHVIFTPVSISITHTRAMRAALDADARAIVMTAFTEDILLGPGFLETDFEMQAAVCRRLGEAFSSGKIVRLTSPRGTDLRFSVEGRLANVLTNIPEPGELAPVPDIEVNVVPVEGTAEGQIVVDASVPYLDIGILQEPITCTVEKGFIIHMTLLHNSKFELIRSFLN
jgi:leucyl aminopeptidase (aminopeptidase T)